MKRLWFILLAIPFGVWLSFAYINPYGGTITLSELVLQLSGARGTFALGLNLSELLDLTLRLVPMLVFQALAGTLMYQYYCTASVYVFSQDRTEDGLVPARAGRAGRQGVRHIWRSCCSRR